MKKYTVIYYLTLLAACNWGYLHIINSSGYKTLLVKVHPYFHNIVYWFFPRFEDSSIAVPLDLLRYMSQVQDKLEKAHLLLQIHSKCYLL